MNSTEYRQSKFIHNRSLSTNLSFKSYNSELINRQQVNTPDEKNPELAYSKRTVLSDFKESFPIRDPPKIKQDIKQHLDVACFLLAVEVEKLNKECSQWRSQEKQLENNQIDRKNYEQLTSDLSSKLNKKDDKISEFIYTIDKQQRQIIDSNHQTAIKHQDSDDYIDVLKTNIDLYEKELLSQKDQIDSHSSLQVQQGINKITFQTIQEKYIHEMKNNNDYLQEQLNLQYQKYEERFALMSTEVEKLRIQAQVQKQKYQDLENIGKIKSNEDYQIIKKLNFEIQNLTQLVEQKNSELDQIRLNLDEYKEEIKRHGKYHKENEQKIVIDHKFEMLDLTEQLNQSIQINEQQSQKLNRQYKNITQLNQTLDQFKPINDFKIQQISEWESKYNQLSTEFEQELKNYQQKDEQYKKLKIQFFQSEKQIQDLKQYQNEVDEKNIKLIKEVEILTIELRSKLTIIEDLWKRYEQLEYSYNKTKPLEIQVIDQQNNIISLTKEIERKNDQLIQKQSQYVDVSKQLITLENLSKQLQQEHKETHQSTYKYQLEIKQQSNVIKEMSVQLNEKIGLYQKEQERGKNLNYMIEQYEYDFLNLSSEVESLRLRLNTQQNQADDVRLSFQAPLQKNIN